MVVRTVRLPPAADDMIVLLAKQQGTTPGKLLRSLVASGLRHCTATAAA